MIQSAITMQKTQPQQLQEQRQRQQQQPHSTIIIMINNYNNNVPTAPCRYHDTSLERVSVALNVVLHTRCCTPGRNSVGYKGGEERKGEEKGESVCSDCHVRNTHIQTHALQTHVISTAHYIHAQPTRTYLSRSEIRTLQDNVVIAIINLTHTPTNGCEWQLSRGAAPCTHTHARLKVAHTHSLTVTEESATRVEWDRERDRERISATASQ